MGCSPFDMVISPHVCTLREEFDKAVQIVSRETAEDGTPWRQGNRADRGCSAFCKDPGYDARLLSTAPIIPFIACPSRIPKPLGKPSLSCRLPSPKLPPFDTSHASVRIPVQVYIASRLSKLAQNQMFKIPIKGIILEFLILS